MSKKRIFISSVQREFSKERIQLCSYIRQVALLGRFFEPFLFEELPAINASAKQAYISEVVTCDIYLGIFGGEYGFQDHEGISPTEREFDEATTRQKYRICFFKILSLQSEREIKQQRFIEKVESSVIRKKFDSFETLRSAVYSSLVRLSLLTHLNLVNARQQIKNAAILLFGKNPQHFFQTSEIKCAQFYGNEVTKPIPSYHVYQGDLFSLVNLSVDFVASRIDARVGTRENSIQAPVDFEIPLDAVREAIVNAVAHRDYTSNASIQVMLFKNRLEIWNPGHLPPGITIEQLSQVHESFPTNPLIANPLYLAGYAERLGTGTADIIKKCTAAGLQPPTFSQSNNFRVTFWRNEETLKPNLETLKPNLETTEYSHPVPKRMTKTQIENLILSNCSNEYLSAPQIATLIRRSTYYLLNEIFPSMLAENKIVRLYPETPNHPNQAYKANLNHKTAK